MKIEFDTLTNRRDELLRSVWSIMNKISSNGEVSMSDEDLDVWVVVTKHSAIQSRLNDPV